jgi:acetyltransferase-like isoleucine patch superfamily enzyme
MNRARGSILTRLRAKGGMRNTLRIVVQFVGVRVFSVLYSAWLRAYGVRLEGRVNFTGPIRILGDPRRITIGAGSWLHRGVTLWTHDYGPGYGRITIGQRVTLLTNVQLNSYASITVADDTAFGDGCYVQDNDHGTEPGVPIMQQPQVSAPITIGRDVWFGARCVVLKGVTVGDGTVIGAGSVVVKSLPAGQVAVGVPARVVKSRGDASQHAA